MKKKSYVKTFTQYLLSVLMLWVLTFLPYLNQDLSLLYIFNPNSFIPVGTIRVLALVPIVNEILFKFYAILVVSIWIYNICFFYFYN